MSARRTHPSDGAGLAAAPRAAARGHGAATPRERQRVVIENVQPCVDEGRYAIKRCVGDRVTVNADVFTDGHDVLTVMLRHRVAGAARWKETPMTPEPNDLWRGAFTVSELGPHEFSLVAWVDGFQTWRTEIAKKYEAGQDVTSELLEGAALVEEAVHRAKGLEREWLKTQARLIGNDADAADRMRVALDDEFSTAMTRLADRKRAAQSKSYPLRAERERARYGAWYEMFPRSAGADASKSGTFRDVAARLPGIAAMGFDVLYLPPIHPIGRTHRKGHNNELTPDPGDPGSPWAIGSEQGGHMSVEPGLGTIEDFDRLVRAAAKHGLEIALDLAYQCSPDHPYAREHPEWFRHRPDGTIKYAENPPKKYQDIYPLNFDCEQWSELWDELKNIVTFWIGHGVKVFRVDNPHTKPFRFWQWLIAEVQREHPDTIFLSEAFTRPKVMRQLAKCGFTQSYTYFTWRNTKSELAEYLTELTQSPVREYMRPNLFANTPDILHEYLQFGGRGAFQVRLVLAATLGAAYGIYGPPFELCEGHAVPGTEEYRDSEKYEIRAWDHDRPGHIRDFIARVNRARRENPALQSDWSLRFHTIDNDQLICYSKHAPDLSNLVLVIVNLDPHHSQQGWVHVPLHELGISDQEPFQVHDVLSDARYLWQGESNFVMLDPHVCPAHVLVVRRKIGTERDFDYYL